jgi:hypothetical protein
MGPSTTSALGTLSLTRTRCLICSTNVRWILLCRLPFTRHAWQESNLSPAPTLPLNFPPPLCPTQFEDSTHSKNGNGSLPGSSCYSTANLTHRGNADRLTFARRTLDRHYTMFCVPSVESSECRLGASCTCLISPTETVVWIACGGGTTSSSRRRWSFGSLSLQFLGRSLGPRPLRRKFLQWMFLRWIVLSRQRDLFCFFENMDSGVEI